MLSPELAKDWYETINFKVKEKNDADLTAFYKRFLKNAVEYANIRASWAFKSLQEKAEDDARRTINHDAFISYLTAICRNVGINNVDLDRVMPDRKTKGDFACYIVMFLGLEQR